MKLFLLFVLLISSSTSFALDISDQPDDQRSCSYRTRYDSAKKWYNGEGWYCIYDKEGPWLTNEQCETYCVNAL